MPGNAPQNPLAPHSSSPAELKQRLELERRGVPHLIYRDADGRQVLRTIAPGERRVTIGRREGSGVHLSWDAEVSRLHAELELVGEDWTIADEGLSRNGTFVGGERVRGRRRLADGDVVTIGQTAFVFRAPESVLDRTASAVGPPMGASISAADRCVLVALCRPLHDSHHGLPATNQQIADELHLSVPAVKKRLGSLFERFGLEALAQNEKRVRLAHEVIRAGLVAPGEL
jgi:predicted component of type VI protein secretion system